MKKELKFYRQLSYPGVEFAIVGRKGPGLPHILRVRSTQRPAMTEDFEIEDPNGPKDMYLRGAEIKFMETLQADAKRIRDQRRKQPIPDLRPALGDQVSQGTVGEPGRQTEERTVTEDASAQPVDTKNARGRGKRAQAGAQEG